MPNWVNLCLMVAGFKVIFAIGGYASGLGPPSLGETSIVFPLLASTLGLTGVVLLLSVHSDVRVSFLGGALLLSACSFSNPFYLGDSGTGLILRHIRPEFFSPYFVWEFALRFPTARTFDPYLRLGRFFARLAFLVAFALFSLSGTALIILTADPSSISWLPRLEKDFIQGLGWTLLLLLQLPAVALMIRRTRMAPLSERRRVRLFLGGLIVGTLPMALAITAEQLIPSFREYVRTGGNRTPFNIVVYLSTGLTPLIIAYSVLVQHILDVRLIVRKALQYAMARYTLAAISLLPLAILAGFIYQRRFQPMDQLLRGTEALVLIGTAVVGFGTIKARKKVLDALDRRFFREQYDARLILAGVVEQIRLARNVDEMGVILREQIRKALLPETAVTFMTRPASHSFNPLNSGMEPVAIGSDLAVMIINSKDPLDTDLEDANAPVQSLPEEERQWLAVGGIQLVVPIHGSKEQIHGFIALGGRRNELPYTSEDRLLLTTIANSAGLVLDGGLADAVKTEPTADKQAVLCPACGMLLPETHRSCTLCSGPVGPADVPYILLDKFRLERRLGAGGMGVVYRATDLTLKRTVAVKTLPTVSPEHAIQLRREARAMASVSHPNLALIFGAETWRGKPLLIVEYMNAGTLTDRLLHGAVPPLEATQIGLRLAEVLDHLHGAGILHRDVKPSNIGFIAPDIPKLLDFGLAQLLPDRRTIGAKAPASTDDETTTIKYDDRTVTTYNHDLAGTPAYMSPEVVRGADPDPSLDLWALAMVIYESISLHNPMKKATVGQTLKEVAAARVPDVRTLFPRCPESVAEFLVSALSSDPRDRPKSARDFHTRLMAAAGNAARNPVSL